MSRTRKPVPVAWLLRLLVIFGVDTLLEFTAHLAQWEIFVWGLAAGLGFTVLQRSCRRAQDEAARQKAGPGW